MKSRPGMPPKSNRSRQNLLLILPLLALLVWRVADRASGSPSAPTGWEVLLGGLGVLLVVAGLWIRLCARQWKAERSRDGLVTDGLYGYVRHPLYVGSFLLGLGLSLVLADALLLTAFVAGFAVNHGLVIRNEEAELDATFGDEHARYRARVPAFLPGIRVLWKRPAPVCPTRPWEALVRESDAVGLWLALPLIVGLLKWRGGGQDTASYPLLLTAGLGCLILLWLRLKLEYRALIRRERQRRAASLHRRAA